MWWLLASAASCQELQELRYELRIGDLAAGESVLKVTWLPEEGGERRLLSLETRAELPGGITWTQRVTGTGGPRQGFHAVNEDAQGRWEVQAARHPEGLRVGLVTADGGSSELIRGLDGSTLSWLDPGLERSPGPLSIASAETGEVIEGELLDLGEGAWLFRTAGGDQRLVYGPQGHLLEAHLSVLGQPVELRLDGPPPSRDWGGIEAAEPAGVATEEL
jgi:hypothetical protein